MPTRRMQIVILALLSFLLSSHTFAQNQMPINGQDKAGAQSSASGNSPSLPQRMTFTLGYSILFYKYQLILLPLVTGSFPNHQQARFFIDTGSDATAISENLARELGLTPLPDKDAPADAMTLGGEAIKQVTLPDFAMKASPALSLLANAKPLGDLTFNNSTAIVIPQRDFDFFGVDGIFGTNILKNAGAVFFDGPSLKMTFIIGGNLTATEREQLGFSKAATSVMLTLLNPDNSGVFTVPVTFENNGVSSQVPLILDTCSKNTAISRKSALLLGLQATTVASDNIGVAGTQKMDDAPVETVKIGDLVLHNIPVEYPSVDNEAPSSLQPTGNANDRLGMDILARYRLLIDFSARTLYIMPNDSTTPVPTK